jgi:hypothetical protein
LFVVACLLLRWLFEVIGLPRNFAAASAGVVVSVTTAAVVIAFVHRQRHESSDHATHAERADQSAK